jgi:dTDP-4-dehydrorhamnose 3,5-epimerase
MITIPGVLLTKMNIIEHPKGDIYKIITKSDKGYSNFGELYLSTIKYGAVKAWKKHTKMICNLLVLQGEVKFVLSEGGVEEEGRGNYQEVVLSKKNYYRLTIPPGIVFGMYGHGKGENMVLNFASIVHDKNESANYDYKLFYRDYRWRK